MTFALIIRVAFLFCSENAVSDELEAYSRLNITWNWLSISEIFPDCNYSTLYFCYLRFLFLISENIFFLRSVSIVAGLMMIYVFFRFAESAFSAKNALLSTMIVACIPLCISLSTVTLPMIIYVLLILSGLNFLFLYLNFSNKQKVRYLVFAGILFTLASGFRFEGFAMIFLVVLFMFLFKVRRFYYLIPFSMIFPTVYMSVSYYKTKHLLAAVATSANHVEIIMKHFPKLERISCYVDTLSGVMSPVLLFLAVLGLLTGFFAVPRLRFVIAVVVGYNAIFLIKSYQGTFLTYLERYFLLNAVLLVPFALYFCETVYSRVRKKGFQKILRFVGVFLFVSVFPFYGYKIYQKSIEVTVPKWTCDVVDWYNTNATKNAYVFLDRFDHPYMVIRMDADRYLFPDLPFTVDRLAPEVLKKAVDKRRPCYIFSYRTPDNFVLQGIKNAMDMDDSEDRLIDQLRLVYENEKWTVYFCDKAVKS